MNAAAPLPVGPGAAMAAPREAARVDGGADARADAAASRGAEATDRTTAPRRDDRNGHGEADSGRPFADLLLPATPTVAAAVPAATPAEAPAEPAAGDAAPGQLLALLSGQWLGAGGGASGTPADTASSAAASHPRPTATAPSATLASASGGLTIADAAAALPIAPQPALVPVSSAADGVPPIPVGTPATGATLAAAIGTAAGEGVAFPAMAAAVADAAVATEPGTRVEAPSPALLSAIAPAAATRPQATLATAPIAMPAEPADGFDDGFGARIAWMAEQRIGHAEIRLNPEHVGRIDVRVHLDGSQVRAEFASAHAEVRQAIEASLPRLRELLGQHGLQLGQADVGQRQSGQGDARAAATAAAAEEGRDGEATAAGPRPAAVRLRGLLDAYA